MHGAAPLRMHYCPFQNTHFSNVNSDLRPIPEGPPKLHAALCCGYHQGENAPLKLWPRNHHYVYLEAEKLPRVDRARP
jgi:hypothetical protein